MSRGVLVTPELRQRIRSRVAEPIALGFGRLGLTPNALTLIGFAISLVAAGFAAAGLWLVAGLFVIVGAVFDLFDGALARATGTAGPVGAFLDSTVDRAGEGAVYVGIVWGAYRAGLEPALVLAAAAMTAAFMVSYTRARAESLGLTGMGNVGLAPREVRIVILTIGLVLAGLLADPATPLAGSLGLIALLATVTAVQRIVHTMRVASARADEEAR